MAFDYERISRGIRGPLYGIVAVLLLATVNMVGFANGKQTQQAKAGQLWEATVAAKGGRERLQKVQSLFIGTESSSGSSDHNLFVFPDRSFRYGYWAGQERIDIDVYNGKRNISWWQVDSGTPHPSNDTESDIYFMKQAQFTFLLMTRWLEPKPLRARKDWIGLKRVDVVETDVGGWRVDYYLDPKTNLPTQVTYGYSDISRSRGDMNLIVRLEDYREVSGIMMPHKVTYSGIMASKQRARYEINVDYDEQIFERGPTPGMKPDGWRRAAKP
jgi:hypothetical protein